jgi:hypothetical protein
VSNVLLNLGSIAEIRAFVGNLFLQFNEIGKNLCPEFLNLMSTPFQIFSSDLCRRGLCS